MVTLLMVDRRPLFPAVASPAARLFVNGKADGGPMTLPLCIFQFPNISQACRECQTLLTFMGRTMGRKQRVGKKQNVIKRGVKKRLTRQSIFFSLTFKLILGINRVFWALIRV
jgi:hypothetical protein